MIEIKVPADPAGAPEQLFLESVIHFVNTEPRLTKPLSSVALAMRLVDAAEAAREGGVLRLTERDHQLLRELIETSEASFIPPLFGKNEAGERVEVTAPPALVRAWVGLIIKAKPSEVPAEPEKHAAE